MIFLISGDMSFFLNGSRRIGVSTMSLTKQLADYFGIADGKGALVTSVTDDGPAAKAGVKAGDVITAIDGEAVDSPGDISRVINRKKEGDVTLTIIRNKSQQTIRVTPREGAFSGTLGQPTNRPSHRDPANRNSDDSRHRYRNAEYRHSFHPDYQHPDAAHPRDAASESPRSARPDLIDRNKSIHRLRRFSV